MLELDICQEVYGKRKNQMNYMKLATQPPLQGNI